MGRREDPAEDAAVLAAVREAVGPAVRLRADANRKWSLEAALAFARAAANVDLEVLFSPPFPSSLLPYLLLYLPPAVSRASLGKNK